MDAFDLQAVDLTVLKPVREAALARPNAGARSARPDSVEDQVPVKRGGVTQFVPVSQIRYVEPQGDYARLHTSDDSHLVRAPLNQLEQDWAEAGFVRIHRSRRSRRPTSTRYASTAAGAGAILAAPSSR